MSATPLRSRSRRKLGSFLLPYLFLAPNTLIFGLFVIIPLLYGMWVSLFRWSLTRGLVGSPDFSNYLRLLQDPGFWASFGNTLWYVGAVVPLVLATSLSLALLVRESRPATLLARLGFYLPAVLSPVVVGVAWRWMFGLELGIVNALLAGLHLPPIGWLTDPQWARVLAVVASVWTMVGFYMVMFLAGLSAIPEEYYEASRIDGAGPWTQFWRITLPLLGPTILMVVILTTINAFKTFELLLVLTGGGPGGATRLVVQNIYETAFDRMDLGYAAAQAAVLFLVLVVLTTAQLRVAREEKEA